MKRTLVYLILFFTLFIYFDAFAQEAVTTQPKLVIISLDKENGLLADPSEVVLSPGDTLQFVVDNGDFNVLIREAYKFLKIKEVDLKLRVESSTNPQSAKYIVSTIKGLDKEYSIYCISNDGWPLAPPRIIIKVD
jgi:plastocyanin